VILLTLVCHLICLIAAAPVVLAGIYGMRAFSGARLALPIARRAVASENSGRGVTAFRRES
jgi:hypothetical protein